MKLLVLKNFNNYYNRIIKKYDNVDDYESNASSYIHVTDVNFNPADGIRTEVVLGKGVLDSFFDIENTNTPDYIVCYTIDSETEEKIIHSRWFIIDENRTRGGQARFRLKRDTIADHFNDLLDCPAFIRKGMLEDDDPFIVQDEGVILNQIKSDEILLKDDTGSAWICAYVAKNATLADSGNIQTTANPVSEFTTIETIASENNIPASDLLSAINVGGPGSAVYFTKGDLKFSLVVNYINNTATEFIVNEVLSNDFGFKSVNATTFENHDTTLYIASTNSVYNYLNWSSRAPECLKQAMSPYLSALKGEWSSFGYGSFLSESLYNYLLNLSLNNTMIKYAGSYYYLRMNVLNTAEVTLERGRTGSAAPIISSFITRYNTDWDYPLTDLTTGKMLCKAQEIQAQLYLELVTDSAGIPTLTAQISSSRNATVDQTFDMILMPYNDITISSGLVETNLVGSFNQALAQDLAIKNDAEIYDVQLLPYFPIPELVSQGVIDISGLVQNVDYDWVIASTEDTTITLEQDIDSFMSDVYFSQYYFSDIPYADVVSVDYEIIQGEEYIASLAALTTSNVVGFLLIDEQQVVLRSGLSPQDVMGKIKVRRIVNFTQTNVKKSIIFYPKSASFSTLLNKSLSLRDSMKIESQCNNYRLCSPNYQGSFDFNVAKNGGSVSNFIAQCTYKPYNPYIKVTPSFGWIYGTNYGDARGLICAGDFSLPRATSAWETYELQNKNYQNIFNRDIQSLDIAQNLQRTQAMAGGVMGAISSGIQGAATGMLTTQNPLAAAGMGIAGLVGSGIGAGLDYSLLEQQLQEQKHLTMDKFSLQLGNIRALPYSISKVGTFTINSKIFPFLEYYTCSDKEKEALQNKITYEGMTIMRVENLSNYLNKQGYLKADIIRNTDIIDSNHVLEDISMELLKGVYL